jgi:hypothetical protein
MYQADELWAATTSLAPPATRHADHQSRPLHSTAGLPSYQDVAATASELAKHDCDSEAHGPGDRQTRSPGHAVVMSRTADETRSSIAGLPKMINAPGAGVDSFSVGMLLPWEVVPAAK